ncbi:hypothetical protein XELAEV_18028564mg [Xenopus laevis]|uniref:Uncharacterized protein n=1 Tax=Xenopus laevis TaxID=8355 RepID=A0A974CR83_XENLA|nr:hypothetical protein XELAEV_18028564mg [Xenopus laevis]
MRCFVPGKYSRIVAKLWPIQATATTFAQFPACNISCFFKLYLQSLIGLFTPAVLCFLFWGCGMLWRSFPLFWFKLVVFVVAVNGVVSLLLPWDTCSLTNPVVSDVRGTTVWNLCTYSVPINQAKQLALNSSFKYNHINGLILSQFGSRPTNP